MKNNTEIFLNLNIKKNELNFFVYEFLKKKNYLFQKFKFFVQQS